MLPRTDAGKIKIELVKSDFLTWHPCSVCGGYTEKVTVLARGHGLLVCETCLKAGNIDERIERHAAALEAMAAETRAVIGRLVVPSYAEWQAAIAAVAEDDARFHRVQRYRRKRRADSRSSTTTSSTTRRLLIA